LTGTQFLSKIIVMTKQPAFLIVLLFTLLPIFVLNAQENKGSGGDMDYYYGYAYHGNDTTYYTGILEVEKDSSEAHLLDEKWKQYFIENMGTDQYTIGIVGPFDSKEAALSNRKSYMEKFVNPNRIVPLKLKEED
jgi:hypothetical protein